MKIIDFFKIEGCEKEDFKRHMLCNNLFRGKVLATMMIAFEVILATIDVCSSMLKVDNRFQFKSYLSMYLLMILINLIYLLFLKRFEDLKNKSIDQLEKLETGMVAYITVIMSWGSVVSLLDQRLYGQLMVFMVNMIMCSVLYYLDNIKILVPYIFSVMIIFIGLPFFQESRDMLIGHYVNLCIFISISWFASRIIFISYYKDFRSRALLNIANHQLKELALIDELTGIPNRRSFRNYIDVAFQNHVGKNSVMSVIMVDIDSFKDFNDHYGHNEGDKVLIAVANQINSIVKHALDFAARWGGEEFIYVSFDKEEADIEKVAETIRQKVYSLKIPHEFSQTCEYVTVSIGAAAISILGKRDVSKAIELADQALYSAKRNGRNCVKSIF